jgi:hypothetical protein
MRRFPVKRILVVLVLLALVTFGVFAQTAFDSHTVTITIAQIESMELETGGPVGFNTVAPGSPGDPVGPPVGTPQTATDRLFYTALNAVGATRHITVETDALVPAGTTLNVVPVVNAGAGTTAGTVTFSNLGPTGATNLVTAIGSVATGRTTLVSGTGLTYNFWVSNASLLQTGVYPILVTYTLTDDIY